MKKLFASVLILALFSGCTLVAANRVFPKLDWYWSADAKAEREENKRAKQRWQEYELTNHAAAPLPAMAANRPGQVQSAQLIGPFTSLLRTNIISFDFSPSQVAGLTAFIDCRTNLASTNWLRLRTCAYPLNGGTIMATNVLPLFSFCQVRAGFSFGP